MAARCAKDKRKGEAALRRLTKELNDVMFTLDETGEDILVVPPPKPSILRRRSEALEKYLDKYLDVLDKYYAASDLTEEEILAEDEALAAIKAPVMKALDDAQEIVDEHGIRGAVSEAGSNEAEDDREDLREGYRRKLRKETEKNLQPLCGSHPQGRRNNTRWPSG